jgi:DNA-binding NarL/FixJ family response regulator
MRGEFGIDRQHVGDLLQALRQLERTASVQPPPTATLTARERQIIAAVVEGAGNREIGKRAKGREGDGTDC